VNISSNGNFSGAAWSYLHGDIDFETSTSSPIDTPDSGAFRANCPKDPLDNSTYCTAAAGCSACLVRNASGTPGTIYGYARVADLATSTVPAEKNGWIKLSGLSVHTIDSLGSPAYLAGSFSGVVSAVNTPASIGGISFNCLDDGTCGTENHLNWKSYIWAIWVGEMSAPNWPYSSACNSGALNSSLKWQITSGKQKKWQVAVSDVNLANPDDASFKSGENFGEASSFVCGGSNNCLLNYGDSYYWWLKLWYSINDSDPESAWLSTPWIQFNHSPSGMGRIVYGESGDDWSFKTYLHEFPLVVVQAPSTTPVIGTSTDFFAYASYYQPSTPTTYYDCDPGNCLYTWSSTDNLAIFSPKESYLSATKVIFQRPVGTTVTVRVTDPSNYFCEKTTGSIDANFSMPLWKEVKVKKDAIQ
jgi:hypothetical protein